MSADLEGFWGVPKAFPNSINHYFIEGSSESLCGKWRLREIDENHQVRPPGRDDCLKCLDIHRELFAAKPPEPEAPPWTVKTDPVEKTHTLLYQGKPQSTVRGDGGLATQNELAAIFNRNGTLPKKGKKVRCAADAPNVDKFLKKKSKHSPELPFVNKREFRYQDLEELVTYMETLFDESDVGIRKAPPYFDQVSENIDTLSLIHI